MPINLHLTPTVPCKHPRHCLCFPHFGTGVRAVSFISAVRASAVPQKAEILVLADAEKGTVIQY